jgi:hypothetical protein
MTNLTITIVVSPQAQRVIDLLKNAVKNSPTGVSLVSIRSYTNKSGEISNNRINIGASYEKAVEKDIEFLKNLDVTTIEGRKSDVITLEKNRIALIEAFIKPNENRSNGQKEAYIHICKGLKVHIETGAIYIYGLRVAKEVLVQGEYKSVKSSSDTIAKNELRKLLKSGKFTQYVINEIESVKANGEEMEF